MAEAPNSYEAYKLTVTRIVGRTVTFDLRIRGDVNWIYIDNITMVEGEVLMFRDNQPENQTDVGTMYRLPRETFEELVQKRG